MSPHGVRELSREPSLSHRPARYVVSADRTAWRARRLVSRAVGLASNCLASSSVAAETWTAGGLSFSDERGGARLLASGTGSRRSDRAVEEIIGPGAAVLEIRNGRTGHLEDSPATGRSIDGWLFRPRTPKDDRYAATE